MLRIRIRCLFDPWIRDPGWVKNPDPGMNNPDHIFESVETIFWVKILRFFFRIRDPGWKINIPDPQHLDFLFRFLIILHNTDAAELVTLYMEDLLPLNALEIFSSYFLLITF